MRGMPEYSQVFEDIPNDSKIVDGLIFTLENGVTSDETAAKSPADGALWRNIQVTRKSLDAYLLDLKTDNIKIENKKTLK